MKLIPTLLASLTLAGCASFDPERWARAVNEHDAGCYAKKQINVVPMLIGIWPVPVATLNYEAVCHPELAPPLSPGQLRVYE